MPASASGARFYRCALQVNPFAYLQRHKAQHAFASEADYNKAMVSALQASDVEVVCVTDHYRIAESATLLGALSKEGIHAFPGFEAVAKDGVHFLCIFDNHVPSTTIERYLGECGIRDYNDDSPIGALDSLEFLEKVPEWGAICVAAHVSSDGGLLRTLKGAPRSKAWTSDRLLACSLPGTGADAPPEHRDILRNSDAAHKRKYPIAVVNAQDLTDPAKVSDPSKTCLIKMTSPSVEALRQAFLDPESRVRLNSDEVPAQSYQVARLTWEGGFLDGISLPLNDNLNCLIGGRGTGKSSVIESLRAVFGLQPLGPEARKRHDAMIKNVIRAGTKITADVIVHRPQKAEYTVEMVVPNEPFVRTADGKKSRLKPAELIPGLEVYGQHEIAELADSPEALTTILARFLDDGPTDNGEIPELKQRLTISRTHIINHSKKIAGLEERLAGLPRLEEQLKRYEDAGIAKHLAAQSAVITEAGEIAALLDLLSPLQQVLSDLDDSIPITVDKEATQALRASPLKSKLRAVDSAFDTFNKEASKVKDELSAAMQKAKSALDAFKAEHMARSTEVNKTTARLLRELGAASADGQDYIRSKTLISELSPLRPDLEKVRQQLTNELGKREEMLRETEDLKAKQFRALERAAKQVTKSLKGTVRVSVTYQGAREPLYAEVRRLGGRLAETVSALERQATLTPLSLVQKIREGAAAVQAAYGLTQAAAEKLATMPMDLALAIEEVDLRHTTTIELNIAAASAEPTWRRLKDLSDGQRATAVLLLLLLQSPSPLVVDQPEDDLDNRFIYDGIVPRMRMEKHRRQFIFATHNANIPVLGDAELIACLTAGGDGTDSRAELNPNSIGSIDVNEVRHLVEQVLEGGAEAFELRRKKYRY